MDERSLKRLGVMVLTAIIIIVVLKYVGLKMATTAKAKHDSQVSAQQASAPAAAPVQPPASDAATDDDLTLPLADDTSATSEPAAPAMAEPAAALPAPDAASAPDDAPPPADPTISTPPASLNAN